MKIIFSIKIIVLMLLFLTTRLYAEEPMMRISLESIINTDVKQTTVIYQGSPSSELLNLLRKARTIRLGNVEKASIFEGFYYIEFFDGKEEKNI